MLIELKKGNKIYIKPKNRGKFTKYCHGKVTNECIQKGKNSSSPTIRKRATFAANARHFKHQNGGIIGNILINGYNLFQQDSSLNKSLDNYKKGLEFNKKVQLNNISTKNYMDKALQSENELQQQNPDYNVSPLVVQKKAYDMANQERASLQNQIQMQNAYDLAQYTDLINQKKQQNYMNFVNSVIGGLKNKQATSV